ncbi:hypothetical protein [Streptomyces avermitilis]|uniref:hypothetical protein n=1 Tax=Streptomyces avermitilis TaxID=33903 RepID=UPI003680F0C2
MRYAQGGGLDAAVRARREQVRIAAAECIAAGESDELPGDEDGGRPGRRALAAGGTAALASKGAAGAGPLLTEVQRRELVDLIEQGPAVHDHLDQRWTLSRRAL